MEYRIWKQIARDNFAKPVATRYLDSGQWPYKDYFDSEDGVWETKKKGQLRWEILPALESTSLNFFDCWTLDDDILTPAKYRHRVNELTNDDRDNKDFFKVCGYSDCQNPGHWINFDAEELPMELIKDIQDLIHKHVFISGSTSKFFQYLEQYPLDNITQAIVEYLLVYEVQQLGYAHRLGLLTTLIRIGSDDDARLLNDCFNRHMALTPKEQAFAMASCAVDKQEAFKEALKEYAFRNKLEL